MCWRFWALSCLCSATSSRWYTQVGGCFSDFIFDIYRGPTIWQYYRDNKTVQPFQFAYSVFGKCWFYLYWFSPIYTFSKQISLIIIITTWPNLFSSNHITKYNILSFFLTSFILELINLIFEDTHLWFNCYIILK